MKKLLTILTFLTTQVCFGQTTSGLVINEKPDFCLTDSLDLKSNIGKEVKIWHSGGVYNNLNESESFQFPTQEMKQKGGKSGWGEYYPKEGDVGTVVHIFSPKNQRQSIYLIKIGDNYVPIGCYYLTDANFLSATEEWEQRFIRESIERALYANIMAQKNCIYFENWESSQNWVREVNKLDDESRKDSILNKIRCERFFKKDSVEYFKWIIVVNGYMIQNIPEYRDSLLNHIKADNFYLYENQGNFHRHHGFFGHFIGFLTISVLDTPIIDNIDALTVLKVEHHKTRWLSRIRRNRRISIGLKVEQSQVFTLRIESFENRDNNRIEQLHLRKGKRTINLSLEREVKVISIINDKNNFITMII